jgi:hypothetical protein
LVALLGLLACSGSDDDKRIVPITDTSGTPSTDFTLPPDLATSDATIYTYAAEWGFPSIRVRPEFELILGWDSLASDAWGEVRSPDSFDRLVLFELGTDEFDMEARLSSDDLEPVITARWDLPIAGQTGAVLSDLTQGTTAFDPATLSVDGTRTWLLALADDAGPRLDIRTGLVLVPDASVSGTIVTIPDGAGTHTWLATIDNQDEVDTSEGHAVYTLDWSGITTDAYGKPFEPSRADELFVARFDEVDEADDLADQVLELPTVAAAWWSLDPAGATDVSLDQATDAGGAAFPGFEEGHIWLVGERCTTCMGPAPLWLTSIRVR